MKIPRQRLTKLADIFDGKTIFRIPSYQRGYAWTEEQWQDLWDDLCFTSSGKTHYTGLLKLTQESSDTLTHHEQAWLAKDPDHVCYYVVDGQQRLTTILLLMSLLVEDGSALRQRYLEVEAGLAVFDYTIHATTQALHKMWHHAILGNQVISVTESNLYTRNIEDAKTFFYTENSRYRDF